MFEELLNQLNYSHVLVAIIALVLVVIFFRNAIKNDENMQSTSGNGDKIILYHIPGCGYCKSFMPIWKQMENKVGSNIEVLTVNCNENKCPSVAGFPTVHYVKADGEVIEFQEERSVAKLLEFINNNRS